MLFRVHAVLASLSAGYPPLPGTFRCITHPFATRRQAEARENILNAFEHYAPGTRENIVGELVQTPLWLERNLNLHRGNVMHLEMTFDQMFALRPWAGASHYRWPGVRGLYLTGASTHPGGGIMGASGRTAARVLRSDLSRRGWK